MSGKLPTIYGSRTLIHLMFQNLLENAIKFLENDDKKNNAPYIHVSTEDLENANFILKVKDNGTGIPKAMDRKDIFLPYKKAKVSDGLGMGLAFVKKAVEIHGGKVWVKDNEDKGCTFCLTFKKATSTTN